MKRIPYIIPVLLFTAFTSVAQSAGKSIQIGDFRSEISDETLHIDFTVTASQLQLNCDGQLTLEFSIENADRRLILPVVVYSGTTRYRYEQRRSALSDGYTAEPYQIYKGVKKNKQYELKYTLSVPYYSWMEHAYITYREYLHDCSGDNLASDGVLLADLNPTAPDGYDGAPLYTASHPKRDYAAYLPNLVSFLDPRVEEPKIRATMVELRIVFPVNKTDVQQGYANNSVELQRADSLVNAISNNPLLTINGMNIRGYASPEGNYNANARLAKGRSEAFKTYLSDKYQDNDYIRHASVTWEPEDWTGLARLVQTSNLPEKSAILAVVLDGSMAPDTKEAMLQKIGRWSSVYRPMLNEMYPKLRRIELSVDYTVSKFDNSKAWELFHTDPSLLSISEMYLVARFYEPGSVQYREVYETAAHMFPDDVVANNNAAAALLQVGLADEAKPYLDKIEGDPASYINLGTYYYIKGETERAAEYYGKAKTAGNPQGEQNIRLINPTL